MNDAKIRLQSRPRSDLQKTLQALPHLLDHEVGLIHSIDYRQLQFDDPQFVHCTATLSDISRFTGRSYSRINGGTALTKEVALAKAIGESIERYCAHLYDPSSILFAAYGELGAQATDPRRFVLFHPDQYRAPGFPYMPINERSVIGWVPGFSLTRDEPTLVPAALIYIPYTPHTREEYFEMTPLSGYACANTLEEAILGGICEVVERDSFMIFWYNQLPVPAIDLRSAASPEVWQILDRYHSTPAQIFCSNITTDIGIPAVLAVLASQQQGRPAAVVATSADLDPEHALAHALLELAANRHYVRWFLESGMRRPPRSPWEVRQQEDHGLLYSRAEMLPYLDLLLRPRWMVRTQDIGSRASEDIKKNIEVCIQRLAQLDLEVIVVDLTTSDVEELGFKVVKVLIPGMQPIDFGMQWPHLGGRRIYEAPQRMRYRQSSTQPWELNLFPHPFP
jgi:ribosomal protein S12 methylthiotransferase accessory factor